MVIVVNGVVAKQFLRRKDFHSCSSIVRSFRELFGKYFYSSPRFTAYIPFTLFIRSSLLPLKVVARRK